MRFAIKSMPSIERPAEFLHLVRTECAVVLPMKNALSLTTSRGRYTFARRRERQQNIYLSSSMVQHLMLAEVARGHVHMFVLACASPLQRRCIL